MDKEIVYYSDGEIEDALLETLDKGKDVFTIPYNGGAVFHNFIDARENLINWYPFKKDATVLEIGAGMGALTGVLCERCQHVVALEHSPKRADIIRQRHNKYKNLEVVSGDIFNCEFAQKFDYVLLIGVLEYMGINSKLDDPYTAVLKRIHSLLHENGIMLLAIENRFGLKYWCGAAEDHTGIPFDGISGYRDQGYTTRYEKSGVRTFSKDRLKRFLANSGFEQQRWYYPLPDYKFPAAVFSDSYLPKQSDIDAVKFSYPIESELVANEKELYGEVIDNENFDFFANSFLVEGAKSKLSADYVKYASLKRDYSSEYRIATIIDNGRHVIKKCVGSGSEEHLAEIFQYESALTNRKVPIINAKLHEGMLVYEWQDYPRTDVVFARYLEEGKKEKAGELLKLLRDNLLLSSETYKAKKCDVSDSLKFEFDEIQDILVDGYIDMTFANSFYDGGGLLFFDQEWRYRNVPVKFILYRAIKYAYKDTAEFAIDTVLSWVGITSEMVQQFAGAETIMLKHMMDKRKCDAFDPNMYHEGLTLRYQQNQTDMRLNDKNAKLEEQDILIEAQKQQLEMLYGQVEELTQQVKEQNNQAKERSRKMQEQTCLIENQKDQLKKQHILLAEKEQTIRNKEGHIELLLEVEREYEREKQSRTYRLALKFRKLSLWLLPANSKRRFFAGLIKKAVRHPRLMLKMINPRRIKNCFTILKTEGIESAVNHYQLVEEYEKSRTVPLNQENIDIVEVTEEEKRIEDYAKLTFSRWEKPQVSIIIPVYNQFDYTYHCLESILKNSGDCTYEVILANDCSTDLTTRIEEIVDGITVITNEKNLRFLLNCNHAAEYAKGQYLLFLNNDTQVQDNWLEPLIDLMERDGSVGMVGSKLIYSDGYLQEAGGILWKDASAWNYGSRQNPNDSEFNYVHEADYISGAAIIIRSGLWKEIGGFDTRFVPAYCEDSDLAFEVRKHGYKVMYQPKSVVVHFEGISNGTDVTSGQKKYQVDNQKKFYEKWKEELQKNHFENGTNVFLARERSKDKKHVLVIDHYVPQYDKDAGSKTTFMYLKMLVQKGYQITFLGDNFYQHEPYTTQLQQMGILVLYGPKYAENWKEWLLENMQYFDVFYLNRPHITIKYIDLIREHARGKVIYYGHDLHFLRTKREYGLSGDKKLLEESEKWLKQEMYIMHKADMNYYPSVIESDEIHKIDPSIPVKAITAYVFDTFRNPAYDSDKREGMLFVGGFGHGPNLDAVLWFLDKIFPEVYRRTKAPFYIVGSKAPEEILQIKTEGVVVKGFVSEEELQELYESCRIAVVPLRYGAGVKGKVVEALYYGIPVVTTSVGAEGIAGIEEMAAVKDQEEELIQVISELYNNKEELTRMSEESQQFVREYFSTDAVWNVVKDDFS